MSNVNHVGKIYTKNTSNLDRSLRLSWKHSVLESWKVYCTWKHAWKIGVFKTTQDVWMRLPGFWLTELSCFRQWIIFLRGCEEKSWLSRITSVSNLKHRDQLRRSNLLTLVWCWGIQYTPEYHYLRGFVQSTIKLLFAVFFAVFDSDYPARNLQQWNDRR